MRSDITDVQNNQCLESVWAIFAKGCIFVFAVYDARSKVQTDSHKYLWIFGQIKFSQISVNICWNRFSQISLNIWSNQILINICEYLGERRLNIVTARLEQIRYLLLAETLMDLWSICGDFIWSSLLSRQYPLIKDPLQGHQCEYELLLNWKWKIH